MIHVVGHKNPDTDSVCASIALAELLNQRGIESAACVNGQVNPETAFVLEKFSLTAPEIITDADRKEIFLVDHSEKSQSLENMEKSEIKGIVDHHKLGDITTSNPPEAWIMPVGSTCTVIKHMYDFYGKKIDKNIAGAMLSAILSDTVIFKSATSTPEDEKAAKELSIIAGISDIKSYGIEMFKVKSAIEESTPLELLQRDYKDFNMSGKNVGIGQLELVDIKMVEGLKDSFFDEMKKLKDDGRHSVLFLLTDIMKEGSELLVLTDNQELVEKALATKIKNNSAWLEGVMSRKKQVVPQLEKVFS